MATVPSMITWADTSIPSPTQFNDQIRDAGNFMLRPPLVVLRQTVAQSIADSALTSITFTTEVVDDDIGHSTSTNTSRFVSQTPGYYLVCGVVAWDTNAAGVRLSQWAVNGSGVTGGLNQMPPTTGAFQTAVPAPRMHIYLGAGDYLELQAKQTSTTTLNTAVASDLQSYLSALWVST